METSISQTLSDNNGIGSGINLKNDGSIRSDPIPLISTKTTTNNNNKPTSLLPTLKSLSKVNLLTPPASPSPFQTSSNGDPLDGEELPKFNLEKELTTTSTTTSSSKTTKTLNNNPTKTRTTTTTTTMMTMTTMTTTTTTTIPENISSPPRTLYSSLSCSSLRSPFRRSRSDDSMGSESEEDSELIVEGGDKDDASSFSTSTLSSTISSSLTSTSSNNSLAGSSSPTIRTPRLQYHHHSKSQHHLASKPKPQLNESVGSNWSGSTDLSASNNSVRSVLLRVKLPESHPLITKVSRFPLNFTVKDTLDRIHELVVLENRVNLIIIFNRTILPHHHTLSTYFGADEGIVQTIELKEVTNMSSSTTQAQLVSNLQSGGTGAAGGTHREKPKLLHASSVQNLLNSMPAKKRNSGGKENIMFQPPLPSYTKELDKLFWINSGSGSSSRSIPCLFHKWKSRDCKSSSQLTILYSGGDREDLGLIRKNMRILSDVLQCNIFCYDYTGFGLNTSGKPTMKELCNDISLVFNYLTLTLKIPSSNIILMGKSIGTICSLKFASGLFPRPKSIFLNSIGVNSTPSVSSTPSTPASSTTPSTPSTPRNESDPDMMADEPPVKQVSDKKLGGLILIGAFGPSSIGGNIVNMFLSIESFDHLKKVDRISCPVLMVHGENDDIVNIKSAKKLSKSFSNLFRFLNIREATHWNIDTKYLDDYADDMIDFVKSIAPDQFKRKEVQLPSSYAMSPSKVVGAWLERLQLAEYTNVFLQAGYFEMMAIASLDQSMLELLGVDAEHIPTLLEEIEKLAPYNLMDTPIISDMTSLKLNSSICSNNGTSNNHNANGTNGVGLSGGGGGGGTSSGLTSRSNSSSSGVSGVTTGSSVTTTNIISNSNSISTITCACDYECICSNNNASTTTSTTTSSTTTKKLTPKTTLV